MKNLAVDFSLPLQILLGPWVTLPVNQIACLSCFVASDIHLSKMNLDTKLCISCDIFSDTVNHCIGEINVYMSLEANSMDWASFFPEFLNQFEHPIRLDLRPSSSRCMVVIVVEKFNLRVCFMSSFECFANEVGNDRPWTLLNWIRSRPFVVLYCFINDVPCKDVIAEL